MENKDWLGNSQSVFRILGASSHSGYKREQHDYYATEPKAVKLLLAEEKFAPLIWECACGEGHISKELEKAGYAVISTDVVYRGFGEISPVDFLNISPDFQFYGDIITNPPYKYALEFFKINPPKTVYVSSSRLICALNGDFERFKSSAVAYAWFVWVKGYSGEPVIKWIN